VAAHWFLVLPRGDRREAILWAGPHHAVLCYFAMAELWSTLPHSYASLKTKQISIESGYFGKWSARPAAVQQDQANFTLPTQPTASGEIRRSLLVVICS
jgi:hypothetical protein